MKKVSLLLVGMLVLLVILAGCNKKPVAPTLNNNQETNSINNATQSKKDSSQKELSQDIKSTSDNKITGQDTTKANFSTYSNIRFEYSVSYPKDWIMGEAPTNNDGIEIFDNSGNKITMYASFDSSNTMPQLNFTTLSGVKGNLIESGQDRKSYALTIKDKGIKYFLSINVSKDYYNKHKDDLLNIVKSFTIPSEPKG